MSSFSSNTESIKLPQCPICIDSYNLYKKRPYYICRNAHSICKECYYEHKSFNGNTFCPICKCQMNQNHRQNNDIITLLSFHQAFTQRKKQIGSFKQNRQDIKQLHESILIKQKFKIPRMIQIALLLTLVCIFPLMFVLISQLSYIIINTETNIIVFIIEQVQNIMNFILKLIWTFIEGVHSTCQTLYIYNILYHIVYVVHMILICFLAVFILKLGAEKLINDQWKIKGKNLRTVDLPKNYIEKNCFIVLINFINWTNKVFQIKNE